MSRTSRALSVVAALATAAALLGPLPPASAGGAQATLPDVVPSLTTPEVRDGRVQALALVGDVVVFGGTFSQVRDRGGDYVQRSQVAAYDRRTGAVVTGFAPQLDGEVTALLPGPAPGTVYVGGTFSSVGTQTALRLALLDVATGAKVSSFRPPAIDRPVTSLGRAGGRVYVGGTFTRVGGRPHAGLAGLDAGSGALAAGVDVQFAGHHNAGRVTGASNSPTGLVDLAVSPDGQSLVAIGNFRTVDGLVRDQVAVLDLTSSGASVRAGWATRAFGDACVATEFDSWVRDVDVSPDGRSFVVGSTGGRSTGLCDAVGSFPLLRGGADVAPAWVAATGQDSVYSVVATGAAVYAGGHFRWFNNPLGVEKAGPGAVPRPGIVALDPASGLPLDWNPGRHPRDKGAFALLATDRELLVGTDTEWVGNRQYFTPRLTSFPLAGGRPLPDTRLPGLPGSLNRVVAGAAGGPSRLVQHRLTGSGVSGPVRSSTPAGLADLRGATMLGGMLLFVNSNGTLHRRPFDGVTLGADTVLDPYDDPYWSDVKTGLLMGNQTYRGLDSGFAADARTLTSLFTLRGRLYYTLEGSAQLRSRAVESATGITSPLVDVVAGAALPAVTGATWVAGSLYYVRAGDGVLVRQAFDGTAFSGPTTVLGGPAVDGVDWRGQTLFAGPPLG